MRPGLSSESAERASAGPWLEGPKAFDPDDENIELAFVPFSLAAAASPVGCFVYSRSEASATPLSGRLAHLIDITDFAVTALRPAIEHAEIDERRRPSPQEDHHATTIHEPPATDQPPRVG